MAPQLIGMLGHFSPEGSLPGVRVDGSPFSSGVFGILMRHGPSVGQTNVPPTIPSLGGVKVCDTTPISEMVVYGGDLSGKQLPDIIGYGIGGSGISTPNWYLSIWSGVNGIGPLQTASGNSGLASLPVPSTEAGAVYGMCMTCTVGQTFATKFEPSSFSLREPYVVGPRGFTSGDVTLRYPYDLVAGVKPGPITDTTVVSAELESPTTWGAFGLALY